MNVCLITCFYARSRKVERILRFFLDQTYKGQHTLLLYNNASYPQSLLLNAQLPDNKKIILINNHINLQTKEQYTNVGDIFRDALTYVPENQDVVTFFDSDDIFLPNHTSEGVKGMIRAHHLLKRAYKPFYSYYLHGANQIELSHNNMEPSVFLEHSYLKQKGFNTTSASYHDGWLLPLKQNDEMLVDPAGIPTLLYDWSQNHNTFKISGSGDDGIDNFKAHRRWEDDFGSGVLSPIPPEEAQKYYDLVKKPI